MSSFIKNVFKDKPADDEAVFYRGHSSARDFKLVPSLFRSKANGSSSTFVADEDRMYREIILANPQDFSSDASALERLVRMQHHGLPTRLLDITSNPLMALFFACSGNQDKPGQVITFKVKLNDIKFFDSDTISCIANLAQLSNHLKDLIDTELEKREFNNSDPIEHLLHYIKNEKPYFKNEINPDHIGSVYCVRSKLSNARIVVQSGAFFIFGVSAKIEEDGSGPIKVLRTEIDSRAKPVILDQLDRLNINDSTVYPFIENTAKYIRNRISRA